MDKFLIKKRRINESVRETSNREARPAEINMDDLPADPGKRKKISEYHANDRDVVRRAYLQRRPCQPRGHDFPQTKFGKKDRRFVPTWFDDYNEWLEYSVSKNAAFCLCCYLFGSDSGNETSGDGFTGDGFINWKKKERFQTHVGKHNSAHNQAWRKYQDLMKQSQSIEVAFARQSQRAKAQYRIRLGATVDCAKFLLKQGLAFRGNDEADDSSNQGNFRELLDFLCDHNEEIKKVCKHNAPGNCKLTSPKILKDITKVVSNEVTKSIVKDIGGGHFAILLDESRDVSIKEQAAITLRYVDARGYVIERFIGLVHVKDTTALSLKNAIEDTFSKHGLSISQLRGQGYVGASNMRGEFNGLKSLILKENESAYYVHCFAHQLQLALVGVAKKHAQVALFFNVISNVVNIVGGSCKRRDVLRDLQFNKIMEGLASEELLSGRGLNQETTPKRAGDTRWGSHYGSLINFIVMFASTVDVLEIIEEDGVTPEQRGEALASLEQINNFTFVFNLHLMKDILGVTNELSQALQRKDQDIVNAMKLVKVCKDRFQMIRDDGWESLLAEVSTFCQKNDISLPNMDDVFIAPGRRRRNGQQTTNLHHYKVGLFYTVIDLQLQELNSRFDEINTMLLLRVACLNPSDSFTAFNKRQLVRLAELYPIDFSEPELVALEKQLENYIVDMKSADEFSELKTVGDLAKKLVGTRRDRVYPFVYKLVKLALILPVATASVERAFSAMKIVKSRLRNKMGDDWMNDILVTYIEKDLLDAIDNETIFKNFQTMKTRRELL